MLKLKCRVTFKTPVDNKTTTIWVRPEIIDWYRANRATSPYKVIRVVK